MIQQSSSWAYIQKKKAVVIKDACTSMFIAAFFTIAKTWMKSRCPLTDEWIRYTYTHNGILLRYYSAIKKRMKCHLQQKHGWTYSIIQSEVNQAEKDKHISLICGIKKKEWYKWTYLWNKNRLTDIEKILMFTKGEWRGVWD